VRDIEKLIIIHSFIHSLYNNVCRYV